MKEKAHCS